jgi:hypothetical protein
MRTHLCTFLLCLVASCQHDAGPSAPAEPVDQMPLPPASGTVIGILIDSAHDLALLDDQVVRLREIEARLDVELRRLDADRPRNRPAGPPPGGGGRGPRGGGGGMGGMGGPGGGMGGMGGPGGGMGGMGGPGGGMGGPRGGGMGGPRGGNGPDAAGPDKAATARVGAMRNESLRVALRDALAVFNETQRPRAIELLSQHDIDVEAVLSAPPPTEALPPDEPAERAP